MTLCRSKLLAVDLDDILGRIGFRTQLPDDVTVYTDTATGNHRLGMPPRSDTGVRQDLLKTFLHPTILARQHRLALKSHTCTPNGAKDVIQVLQWL